LEQLAVANIKNNKQSHLRITLPVDSQMREFHLVKARLFTPDFVVVTNGQNVVDVDKGIHYWGIAKDDTNSLITLSVFEDGVVASIHMDSESYTLSKYENSDYHLMYKNSDLNFQPDFSCEAIGLEDNVQTFDPNTEKSITDNCIRIHVEADYGLYQSKDSSIVNTTNYVTGLFNQVAILYANESINIAINYINIWTSTSPYTPGFEFDGLRNREYGRTYGDLVHLLHVNSGNGRAFIDVLCSPDVRANIGVSGVQGSFSNVPTFSTDVNVVAHELGHNVGSPHTHACFWNGDNTAIDGCGYHILGEGCNAPMPPPNGGTIMSYCNFLSGIDFNLGFGPQPGDLMRDKVANATCLSPCGPPACDDGYLNGDEEGIDCGGANCIACPTCDDNILNQDETNLDCGGANCKACPCADGIGISLVIHPDYYVSEISWDFRDASGDIAALGGDYIDDQGTVVEAICLQTGCYDFTIYDSYGDGLVGDAHYFVIDEAGNELVYGTADYDSLATTNFCVPVEPPSCAGVDLDINFDGAPTQTSWEITDASGSVVISGSSYGAALAGSNLPLPDVACLPDGCYDLTFMDAANDGMCPRRTSSIVTVGSANFGLGGVFNGIPRLLATEPNTNTEDVSSSDFDKMSSCGNYTLTDANGTVLASGGGRFGASETNNFCIVGGVAELALPNNDWYSKGSIANNTLQIQPNVVEDEMTVIYKLDELADTQLFIIDITGKILQQYMQGVNDEQQVRLNVSELTAGFYFVKVVAGDTMFTEKFVKQ